MFYADEKFFKNPIDIPLRIWYNGGRIRDVLASGSNPQNPLKTPSFNKHVLRILAREYRTLNLKTVYADLPHLAEELSEHYPDALIAFVRHKPADAVPHYHLVARFAKPTNLKKALVDVATADPCFYCAPCRLFRSSYRYLAHLDSPEKHKVPVDDIVRLGDWDTIPLCDWHLVRRISVDLSEMLLLARDYLVENQQEVVSLIQFGIWLEGKGFNARSALTALRVMGIEFACLCHEASFLVHADTVKDSSND